MTTSMTVLTTLLGLILLREVTRAAWGWMGAPVRGAIVHRVHALGRGVRFLFWCAAAIYCLVSLGALLLWLGAALFAF